MAVRMRLTTRGTDQPAPGQSTDAAPREAVASATDGAVAQDLLTTPTSTTAEQPPVPPTETAAVTPTGLSKEELQKMRLARFATPQKSPVVTAAPTPSTATPTRRPAAATPTPDMSSTSLPSLPVPGVVLPATALPLASSSVAVSTFADAWRTRVDLASVVFGVQLRPSPAPTPRGALLAPLPLPGVLLELEAVPSPEPLDLVTRVLLARFSTPVLPPGTPTTLEWLAHSYGRAAVELRGRAPGSREHALLVVAQQQTLAYLVLVLEDAAMFEPALAPDAHRHTLARLVVAHAVPADLLAHLGDFCTASPDHATALETIFTPIFDALRSVAVRAGSVAGAAPPATLSEVVAAARTMADLTQRPALAALLLARSDFTPTLDAWRGGRAVVDQSFLGPFFRASSVPEQPTSDGTRYYPPDGHGRHRADDVAAAHASLRHASLLHTQLLHTITMNLLKNKDYRSKVVDYFSQALSLNSKRAQHQADPTTLAPDGFMLNLTSVLLKLCAPFSGASTPSFDKIDASYLVHPASRVDVTHETTLGMCDSAAVVAWAERLTAPTPNFVTEVFFMALQSVHVGLVPTLQRYRAEWVGDRSRIAHVHGLVSDNAGDAGLHAQLATLASNKLCFDSALLDPASVENVLAFYGFVASWLVHVTGVGDSLFLLEAPGVAMQFSTLPEFILEDFADFLTFMTTFAREVLDHSVHCSAIVRFLVAFIGNGKVVRNCYLRAKLVHAIARCTPSRSDGASRFFETVQGEPLSVARLAASLMQFYVDAEDTDFYSRLSMRDDVQVILKDLWGFPRSRQGFIEASKSATFVRFVMLLINDTTFLLDEARTLLYRIQGCQDRLATASARDPDDTRTEQEVRQALSQSVNQIGAVVRLADETLNMFGYITKDIVEPFLRPELVTRLAAMLNYNVAALVGDKSVSIRPSVAGEFGFNSGLILTKLVEIYLHCSRVLQSGNNAAEEVFVAAIAGDGRSYRAELMAKTAHVLESQLCVPPATVAAFRALFAQVAVAAQSALDEEAELEDIPDEFLDPILSTLMRDPVTLPRSNISVDRGMLLQHLLSDPTDPFNKQPLSIDDVVPNVALRASIDAWVADRKRAAAAAAASAAIVASDGVT